MTMATLRLYGPFFWSKPFGQNAFMPGEEHPWFVGDFTDGSLVFQVSAHPSREGDQQGLAVTELRIDYARSGGPVVNFVVRNIGRQRFSTTACSLRALASDTRRAMMRVFAIHDAGGTISEIVTAPDDGPVATMVTRPGMSMTEIDVPEDLQLSDDVDKNAKGIAELVQQYRVIVEPGVTKLERQVDSAT